MNYNDLEELLGNLQNELLNNMLEDLNNPEKRSYSSTMPSLRSLNVMVLTASLRQVMETRMPLADS